MTPKQMQHLRHEHRKAISPLVSGFWTDEVVKESLD